jgi:hypothetical protein
MQLLQFELRETKFVKWWTIQRENLELHTKIWTNYSNGCYSKDLLYLYKFLIVFNVMMCHMKQHISELYTFLPTYNSTYCCWSNI